jgi:acetolactate synthase-1/2/3 large subunit
MSAGQQAVQAKPGAKLTGGQVLVEGLRREGVKHVFCVPGESYLGALDALYDAPEIRIIVNRQEGGACYMAEGYAKATRSVGVCFVTRGPGATNASIGIHCADQDSTPLVLFVGQVPRANRGREALQEVDYERFFGSMAKWVVEPTTPARLAEAVPRAFHIARSGRPGPVVVSLPEDMLVEQADARLRSPLPRSRPHPDPAQIAELARRIAAAEKPALVVGSGVQYGAREALVHFAERYGIPVTTSFRRMDAFPNSHPNYAGTLASGMTAGQDTVRGADLVVVIGDRLSENTTNDYRIPAPGQALAHVDVEPEVIGQNFATELGIVSDAGLALEALLEHSPKHLAPGRDAWVKERHGKYLEFSTPSVRATPRVSMERVSQDLSRLLPKDAILTVDAGNFSGWIHRFYRFDTAQSFLGPTVGSMGYGLPAAIGAKLAHPRRTVIATCGDGGALMTMQELATAVQHDIPVILLVFNNGTFGTIRMHQEREFPGRTVATDISNPDFAALGRAMGAQGYTVRTSDEFAPALQAALASGKPAVLDVMSDPEHISVSATLADLRAGKGVSRRAK